MKFTSREIFGIFLVIITALLSLGAWSSFFDLSLRPDFQNTLLATLWFSFLGTFFFLGAVVWQRVFLRAAGAIFLFSPSFLFTHTWLHILSVFLSGWLAFLSLRIVQNEINERIRFHFIKNVRVGGFTLIFGLSLSLSSAYFASIRSSSWEELVPRFGIGEGTASMIFKTAGYFYPEYQKLSEEGVTVDGFLESLQKNNQDERKTSLSPREKEEMDRVTSTLPELTKYLEQNAALYGIESGDELAHQLYLRSGRQQISTMAGKEIRGDEKIADVFSYALQHRIIAALSAREASDHLSPQIVPAILAILLFVTLLSVGSLLSILWAFLGLIFFRVALFLGFIKKIKIPLEQEGLER